VLQSEQNSCTAGIANASGPERDAAATGGVLDKAVWDGLALGVQEEQGDRRADIGLISNFFFCFYLMPWKKIKAER
jgi:hypothetical protein